MAYSTPYTFTALELVTAAMMNAIQTNISSIWVGTTAGDVDYYTSSTTKGRLAIGTAYQFKQVNSGATAPQWGGLHFALITHNTTQNFTTGVSAALIFNTDTSDIQAWHDTSSNTSRITVGSTGYYQASYSFKYAAAGGSGTYWDTVEVKVNGTTIADDRRFHNVDAFSKIFMSTTPIFAMTAGQYAELFLEQTSGGTRAVQSGCTLSLWRVA